ncbi:MAG TPA: LamG domain-containing protein [Melioribacteraceae bacterium]|nr:LamG domain-containing protein [Melioribacteraceae bacterium]
MIRENIYKILLIIVCSFSTGLFAQSKPGQVTWQVDNLNKIGGNPITLFGNPVEVETEKGKSVRFDGVDDGIIVHANPIDGANSFTVEIIFKPDTSSNPVNKEQRFLHIQAPGYEPRRMLIELRLTDGNKWFLDTHINADTTFRTLYAENYIHPLQEWYHAVLVYDKGVVRHFVNGREEMSGTINYIPIKDGNVSLGMRMNKRSFFKGEIKLVRFTDRALTPEEFLDEI